MNQMSFLFAKTVGGLHEIMFSLFGQYVQSPSEVLDLGAGTGIWALKLYQHGYIVETIEVDQQFYKANSIPCIHTNLNSEFSKHFNKNFDAITSIEVIEHLENPLAFLRECYLLLKPGGFLFISTPNFQSIPARLRFLMIGELRSFGADPTLNDPTHISPIHSDLFKRLAEQAGFHLIRHTFNKDEADATKLINKVICRFAKPFLKGITGGDCHIFVLQKK